MLNKKDQPAARPTTQPAWTQTLIAVGILSTNALPAWAIDANQLDRMFSYNIGNLRIRPQLDTSATFNNNLFFAGNESFQFLETRNLVIGTNVFTAVTSTNTFPVAPRQSDVLGSVSPGIKIQYGSDDGNVVNVEYNNDNVRYFDTGFVPPMQHRLTATTRYNRSRFTFDASHNTRFLSSFLGGGANQRNNLVDRWTSSTSAKLTYDSSAKTDVYLGGNYDFTDYLNNVALYGYNIWRGTLGATYKPTERIGVFMEGHYAQQATVASSPTLPGAPYSQVYGGFIGVRAAIGARIEGTIRVGYELREFPNRGTSFGIPAVEARLSYAPRPSTLLTLNYSRRTDVGAQLAGQQVTTDAITFNASQQIGTKNNLLANLGLVYNVAEQGELISGGSIFVSDPRFSLPVRQFALVDYARTETFVGATAGITYIPRRWLRVNLSYDYENFSPSFKDSRLFYFLPSYDQHRVTASVNIGY
jgi:hypothetical protein